MARWLQQQMGISSGPLQCLSEMDAIKIKEKASVVEAVTAILGQEVEMANKYQVYALGGVDDLFYAVERTNFVGRNLKQCCSSCTPWTLDILYSQGLGKEPAFHLERPTSATCCCFNRPVVEMTDSKGATLGSLHDNSICLGPFSFTISDTNGEKVLTLDGSIFNCGFWLPLPCGPCSEVELSITRVEDGEKVGNLKKVVPSIWKFMVAPDADNYKVHFGGVQSPELRALIMAAAIFLDFEYFNDNSNDDAARQSVMGSLREKLLGGPRETPRESMMQWIMGQ